MPALPKSIRVAVVGSRDFPSEDMVLMIVHRLPRNAIIVSGGARGVDKWAELTANFHKRPTDIYLPNWSKHGKTAGFIRNNQIVRNCDMLIAFHHNKSKGTAHSISLCKYLNVPYIVIATSSP